MCGQISVNVGNTKEHPCNKIIWKGRKGLTVPIHTIKAYRTLVKASDQCHASSELPVTTEQVVGWAP